MWRRYGAALLSALMLGGLLAAGHHRATASHGYCTEHGHQVHLEQRHPSGHLSVPATHARIQPATHVHGAHFCAELAFLAQSSEQPLAAPAGQGEAQVQGALCLARAPRRSTIPLLHQAPKHSPPA